MRKQTSFAFALLFLIIGIMAIASAGKVELEITTYPYHDVTVNILDPNKEEGSLLFALENATDSSGIVVFNFETGVSKMNIAVAVRKNGHIVAVDSFEGYTPVGQIPLTVLKKQTPAPSATNQTNHTANNTANQTSGNATNATNVNTNVTIPTTNSSSTENQTSSNKTDFSISGYFSDFPIIKVIVYAAIILGVIIIIGGIVLFLVLRKRNRNPTEIKVKKYSELKEEIKERNKTADEKKIDELEDKIKGLQTEVDEIKNKKSKIKEVEEKIKKDMAELERLKK